VKQARDDRLFKTETDFVAWLTGLMRLHPDYDQVAVDPIFQQEGERAMRPDVMAVRKARSGSTTVLIECKNWPLFGRRLADAISQIKLYGTFSSSAKLVLAVSSELSDDERQAVESRDIELWDIGDIARIFSEQMKTLSPGLASILVGQAASETKEERLLQDLKACAAGKGGWPVYQKLVGRVLEHCFCPPLNPPLGESPDESGTNRRDFVLANFAESGFWAHMRSRYRADYVVVDAKNYAGKVKKRDILQMSNYLKPYGTGLFGIIVSRNGADQSARITARELWAHSEKLVITLNDEQCRAMINGARSGDSAQVLNLAIQDFRLSM
jgi:hypothetical protein